jgi:nucleotide-binding universal stress UspA family protein
VYRRLLIATDGSELAAKAVRSALALAKQLGARVVIVTAMEPWSSMTNGEGYAFDVPMDEYEEAAVAHAERILASARADAQNTAIECEAVRVSDFQQRQFWLLQTPRIAT